MTIRSHALAILFHVSGAKTRRPGDCPAFIGLIDDYARA
jgi:hypothetical protein